MQQLPAGNTNQSEAFSHSRRVCALARRTGRELGLPGNLDEALGIAASLHQFCGSRFRAGSILNLAGDLQEISAAPPAAVPDFDTLALAEQILIRFLTGSPAASDAVETAAAILEICNEFDETVEFAALGGESPTEAIMEFHRQSAAPAEHPRGALCKVTTPSVFRADEAQFPVLPRAASRLLRTTDETDPFTLESIVARDPILTGRLLAVANSASYGPLQPVVRLAEAAARVGVPMARKVLLAACFGQVFASGPLRSVWADSQLVANRMAGLAQSAGLDRDEAYVAGLLHDVGRLVLERTAADSRVRLHDWVASGLPLPYAEVLTYGTDHSAVGADLLRSWNLPGTIVDAVENHHAPERSSSRLASALYLAQQNRSLSHGEEPLQKMRTAYALRMTGLSVADLDRTDVTHLLAATC